MGMSVLVGVVGVGVDGVGWFRWCWSLAYTPLVTDSLVSNIVINHNHMIL
jgi:hypothetical protein